DWSPANTRNDRQSWIVHSSLHLKLPTVAAVYDRRFSSHPQDQVASGWRTGGHRPPLQWVREPNGGHDTQECGISEDPLQGGREEPPRSRSQSDYVDIMVMGSVQSEYPVLLIARAENPYKVPGVRLLIVIGALTPVTN